MSDGDLGRWHDVDLGNLSPDQRVRIDQALRAESIPATWGGTVLRVDEAYEPRVSTLVEEALGEDALVEEARPAPPSPAGAPAGAAAPPPYGTPPAPYAAPVPGAYPAAPAAPSPPTNNAAVVSLVCGVAGLLTGCVPTGPVGLWFGLKARREIRERGEGGEGIAVAGLITSGIATALLVIALLVLLFVVLVAVLGAASS
jgi:hypothetical protein